MLLASLRRLALRRTVSTPHARCMHLSPRELDHLQLAQVGFVAQRRLSRGVRLNAPEATALIATQMLEMIRDGTAVSTLMETGKQLLGRRQVQAGVADMVAEVQVEGTFPDGTKLLTVCPSRAPRPPAPAPVAAPASPASLCQRESRTRSPAPFSSRPAQPTASDLTLPARLALNPCRCTARSSRWTVTWRSRCMAQPFRCLTSRPSVCPMAGPSTRTPAVLPPPARQCQVCPST